MITITIGSSGKRKGFRAPMPYCAKCYMDGKGWFEEDPRFSRKYPMMMIDMHTFKCKTCGQIQTYGSVK